MNDFIRLAAVMLAVLSAPACAEEVGDHPRRDDARAAVSQVPGTPMGESKSGGGVARLPFARGKTFRTLDEYLAHLERQGAIDLPYWRQIEPGLYERVTSRVPAGPPERATRADLMRRFGFTR